MPLTSNKSLIRVIVLITVVLWSATIVHSQNDKASTIKLSTRIEGSPCLGDTIKYIVRLDYVGRKRIAVDARSLQRYRSMFYFPPTGLVSATSYFGDQFPTEKIPDSSVKFLSRGENIEQVVTLSARENEFFGRIGRYRIDIGYGQFNKHSKSGIRLFTGRVVAEPVSFELAPCTK